MSVEGELAALKVRVEILERGAEKAERREETRDKVVEGLTRFQTIVATLWAALIAIGGYVAGHLTWPKF